MTRQIRRPAGSRTRDFRRIGTARRKHADELSYRFSANGWVAEPDNVAFDPKGRIWISTDGQDDAAGFNDSLYAAQVSGPNAVRPAAFSTARAARKSAPSSVLRSRRVLLGCENAPILWAKLAV